MHICQVRIKQVYCLSKLYRKEWPNSEHKNVFAPKTHSCLSSTTSMHITDIPEWFAKNSVINDEWDI